MNQEERKYLALWRQYRENSKRATPIDLAETPAAKLKRIATLEANPEAWKKYFFPHYCTSEPAPFHIGLTKRCITNDEWDEVVPWARELSKTSTAMMIFMYLTLTGKKSNIVVISNTFDNAKRLMLPFKVNFEANQRIINDYGIQENIGSWEAHEFITKSGVSFRAVGAGQNPRGTKNDAKRPDGIVVDDIDTDEACRNPQRVKDMVNWVNEALKPTRSTSNGLLFLALGNIIAKYSVITELMKTADYCKIVNIRDNEGKSTWPQKNTEALIDRVLSKISWRAQQKEYFNNPVSEGDTFKEITYGNCPPLKHCDQVVVYADPATSNKDRGKTKQASHKSVVIVGSKGRKRYLYRVWLDQCKNAVFVGWLYEAYLHLREKGVDTKRIYIENNSLQDPFYRQVLLPLIYQQADQYGFTIPITEDKRKKPDKFFRVEGTLEPLNRMGNLIFNKALKDDPHMRRMHDQMLGVSEKAIVMDGPDCLEGASWIIQNRAVCKSMGYAVGAISNRRY